MCVRVWVAAKFWIRGEIEVQRNLGDKFLSFFERSCLKDGEVRKKRSTNKDFDPHKRVMDIVSRWLLHVDSGSSGSQIGSQGSWVESCGKCVPEPGLVSVKSPILGKLKQQIRRDLNAEMNPFVKDVTGKQAHGYLNGVYCSESDSTEGKECSDCLLDMSQISGPDGKSKPTPISQIGFRDPASFGGGQQLALLSVEVLEKSFFFCALIKCSIIYLESNYNEILWKSVYVVFSFVIHLSDLLRV
ncbi:hypothetical protein RHSIM_Rhsim08G0103800 [Rhododendron simsii]|uniref:Uncharacterized protein n=1 Tax=Rhododendron simsii TaxID=118357 RepID=A0A834GPT2_RHOSS|nr:hypothetical protein RHSIM_Rhsim08G0103800 [Rhododendron simsii]